MIYAFGSFELDDERFELRSHGTRVVLQRKSFDVIHFLVSHRDRVVSKSDLLAGVWRDVHVRDTALAQAILCARKALDDDDQRVIETIRGRGYRFIAPVTVTQRTAPAALPGAPLAPPTNAEPPLVDRDQFLSALQEALGAASNGRGLLLLLTGGAGIGRSRAITEAAQLAITTGRVEPTVVHVTRDRTRAHDDLARLAVSPVPAAPALVAVDDAHLLETEGFTSIATLAARTGAGPLVLVVACRSGTPGEQRIVNDLHAILATTAGRIVALEPLSNAGVARLLEHALGRPPSSALLTRVIEKTGGNPLLVQRLAHVVRSGEALAGDTVGTTTMLGPTQLQAAMERHLLTLPDDVRDVLVAASVLGAEFELSPLALSLERPPADVLAMLELARSADVIAAINGGRRFRFGHAIVRDMLYRRLGVAERARRHAAAGHALLAHARATAAPLDDGALATHFCLAAPTGCADSAIAFATRAAKTAIARGAVADALSHCSAAFEAAAYGAPLADRPEAASALVEVVVAIARASNGDHAPALRELLARARTAAAQCERPEASAAIAAIEELSHC